VSNLGISRLQIRLHAPCTRSRESPTGSDTKTCPATNHGGACMFSSLVPSKCAANPKLGRSFFRKNGVAITATIFTLSSTKQEIQAEDSFLHQLCEVSQEQLVYIKALAALRDFIQSSFRTDPKRRTGLRKICCQKYMS